MYNIIVYQDIQNLTLQFILKFSPFFHQPNLIGHQVLYFSGSQPSLPSIVSLHLSLIFQQQPANLYFCHQPQNRNFKLILCVSDKLIFLKSKFDYVFPLALFILGGTVNEPYYHLVLPLKPSISPLSHTKALFLACSTFHNVCQGLFIY